MVSSSTPTTPTIRPPARMGSRPLAWTRLPSSTAEQPQQADIDKHEHKAITHHEEAKGEELQHRLVQGDQQTEYPPDEEEIPVPPVMKAQAWQQGYGEHDRSPQRSASGLAAAASSPRRCAAATPRPGSHGDSPAVPHHRTRACPFRHPNPAGSSSGYAATYAMRHCHGPPLDRLAGHTSSPSPLPTADTIPRVSAGHRVSGARRRSACPARRTRAAIAGPGGPSPRQQRLKPVLAGWPLLSLTSVR